MRTILLGALALSLSTAALAQSVQQISPQVRIQTQTQVPQLRPTARQIALLNAANVRTTTLNLRAATLLSVRNPVTEDAWLTFRRVREYDARINAIGSAWMESNPDYPGEVHITFQGDATSRYILDCVVQGPDNRFKFLLTVHVPGGVRHDETIVTVSGGRVGMVVQPRGTAGLRGVALRVDGRNSWQFNSCEITPFG